MKNGVKHDEGKNRLDLIPMESIWEIGRVFTYGAERYGENNWKNLENPESRCMAAALRHLAKYQIGEKTDDETGISHLAHAATNLLFLIFFEKYLKKT